MHFSGTEYISQPVAHVWQYLMDVGKVASCAPGFKGLIPIGDAKNAWEVELELRILLLKIRMILDVRRPVASSPHMTIKGSGDGSGGGVNFATDIHLDPFVFSTAKMEHTVMTWSADVVVIGKLANLGAKAMQGFIEKQTAAFFVCLKDAIEGYHGYVASGEL